MRLDDGMLSDVLADAWERWAQRCTQLSPAQWSTPTRCAPWDVQALVAHLCPDEAMFDTLLKGTVDGPPAISDAAEVLRRFNEPDGIANTSAGRIAQQAVDDATAMTREAVVTRFTQCARQMRAMSLSEGIVIRYPVVGSTTLRVIGELALMEATVHLLDLADAVGGAQPSAAALAATRDLLIAIPDPTAAVEVLAGRREPGAAIPAIR